MPYSVVATLNPAMESSSTVGTRDFPRCDSHRAAIVLNNTAVSLLMRGFFRDAMMTLQDAVVFIGHAPGEETVRTAHIARDDISHALDRACKRSAALYDKATTTSSNECDANSRNLSELKVISTELNPTRVYEALTSANVNSVKMSFPMKIDPIDYERCTNDDIMYEGAVVMYNYGVALECMASSCVRPPFITIEDAYLQTMYLDQAHHVYQSTRALLHSIDRNDVTNAPISLASQVLLLRTVLTHNMLNLAIKLSLGFEYSEYSHAMIVLLSIVEAQQAYLPIEDRNLAAAA